MRPLRPPRPPGAALLLIGLASAGELACHADAVAPPPSYAYDVERYALVGEFDWDQARLNATLEVALTLDAAAPPVVTLDSAVTEVTAVRAADGDDLPFFVDADAHQLTIDTAGAARGGDALVLHIEYAATAGESLRATLPRVGDPVAVRALYTLSEPRDAPTWMPCHDDPADRARFSVEMRMPRGTAMIANGELELDAPDGADARRMRYATRYTLPNYLMAFAIAEFEVASASHGALPIAVWHRPGVPGDYPALLAELDRLLGLYEARLGPYPFEKYALVLLPGMSGGMENASITFQSDSTSTEPSLRGDVQLTAHELAHHWFGDLVTVATWDDVWIKEGLATLLSGEALRATEDLNAPDAGSDVLLGDRLTFAPADAIRDPTLAPEDKYTSGPYDHAAWLLTQIRAAVGEAGFWDSLRRLLTTRRLGVVGTDDLLAAFSAALGPDRAARARRAIDAVEIPTIELAAGPVDGVVVTLHDDDATLVAAMEVAWHREDGTIAEPVALVPGQPLTLTRGAPGDFLVFDPRNVHPPLWMFLVDDASRTSFYVDLAPLLLPTTPEAVTHFTAIAGVHQSFALSFAGLPPVAPTELAAFLAALDAEGARALALEAACDVAGRDPDPAAQAAWTTAVTAAITDPALAGFEEVRSYAACTALLAPRALFADEYDDLAAGLEAATLRPPRLTFLSKFEVDPADARATWAHAVGTAYSLRARAAAARAMYATVTRLAPEDAQEQEHWRALVLELLGASETAEQLGPAIAAAVRLAGPRAADNADLLAALARLLHAPTTRPVHTTALCAALALTVEDAAAWAAFTAGLADAPLSRDAALALADVTRCS